MVAPDEEFWTYLGIDQAIKVEYKYIKRLHSKDGVFNKQNKFTYEYHILVINNKKTEEELVIWDQLPISENEKIKVNLIQPEYKEDNDVLKKSELNYLEWFYKLKPGEVKKIPFKFVVEYPLDKRVEGLE